MAEIGVDMERFPTSKHLAIVGLECVLVTMRVRVNARVGEPAKATYG